LGFLELFVYYSRLQRHAEAGIGVWERQIDRQVLVAMLEIVM